MFGSFIEFMQSDSSKRVKSLMIKAMFLLFLSTFVAIFNKDSLLLSVITFLPSLFMNIYFIVIFVIDFKKYINNN